MQKFYISTEIIYKNKTITTKGKRVNAILFRNPGDVDIFINNEIVAGGSSYQVINNGQPGEVDDTDYSIVFDPATAGTAPQCVIRYKIYK